MYKFGVLFMMKKGRCFGLVVEWQNAKFNRKQIPFIPAEKSAGSQVGSGDSTRQHKERQEELHSYINLFSGKKKEIMEE